MAPRKPRAVTDGDRSTVTKPGPGSLNGNRARDREVIEAAVKIFWEKGYANASVQDVADALGMLKGSLYYYIDSKERLAREDLRRLARRAQPDRRGGHVGRRVGRGPDGAVPLRLRDVDPYPPRTGGSLCP